MLNIPKEHSMFGLILENSKIKLKRIRKKVFKNFQKLTNKSVRDIESNNLIKAFKASSKAESQYNRNTPKLT